MRPWLSKPVAATLAAGALALGAGGIYVASQDDEPEGECIAGALNAPGTEDPWGGCWPGPQNTGYPHGVEGDTRDPVTLTEYTGPDTINSCGTVIDSKHVPPEIAFILLTAGNGTHSADTPCLTIRNSLIEGTVHTDTIDDGPILIEDTEFDTGTESLSEGVPDIENVGRYNIFGYRIDSHGGDQGLKCAAYCEYKDSWAHANVLGGFNKHYNAIMTNGIEAGSWNIEHNWAACGDWEGESAGEPPTGDTGCSADIGFYGDFDPVRDITVHRNYLRGQTHNAFRNGDDNQSAYCLNPGYYPAKPFPAPEDITVTENVFGRGDFGTCGVFGPANSINAVGDENGTVWTGNEYEDGVTIPRSEE